MPATFPPHRRQAFVLAGITALLAACSPLRAINLLVPRSGYSVQRAIAFGADPRQKLDVYIPDGLTGKAPVLLFFYGGSWETGNRGDYLALGQAFASAGIVTVIADYRLYPQVKYPAFVQDAASALAFVHAHTAQYGGDPARVFVAGHSAGGYNAVMLASDPQFIKAVGGAPDWMAGVIGISGPYDFLPLTAADYIDMFHGPENHDAMPINHIDGPRPPMLLVTGDADDTVSPGNTDRMAARLRAAGNSAAVIKYPGVGHIGIILSLVPGLRDRTSLREDMVKFIRSH
jgi:acetyl esterase/lipase